MANARGSRRRRLTGTWVGRGLVLILVIAVLFLIISRGSIGTHGVSVGQPLQIGKAPPDIRGVAFDGSSVQLSSLKGKVVLVNFFASW